ncbi:MAG: hypothetical protein QNJ74_04495 [Trichodesmium sp. MO_231.B1]|nr:hypothetical protein [Trichodesmium sp. MO_231.B1]
MVKEAPGVSGDGEIRRWGDSQMGRFADGEIRRWGEIKKYGVGE